MPLARPLFLSLSLRERLLIVTFILVMLGIWGLYLNRALRTDFATHRSASVELETQALLFGSEDAIKQRLEEALANLDSARTYSANQLEGRIDDLARGLGLKFDLSSAVTQDSDIFATHVLRLRIDNGNLSDLVRFNAEIQKESPYIVLNQCQISANQRDQRLLDASFEISSIELKANVGL